MPFQKGQSGNPKGKPRGVRAKATVAREAEIKASGLTPLDFMMNTLRNEQASAEDRKWAAQNAAPYVHPRLSSVDARLSGQVDLRQWLQSLGEPD